MRTKSELTAAKAKQQTVIDGILSGAAKQETLAKSLAQKARDFAYAALGLGDVAAETARKQATADKREAEELAEQLAAALERARAELVAIEAEIAALDQAEKLSAHQSAKAAVIGVSKKITSLTLALKREMDNLRLALRVTSTTATTAGIDGLRFNRIPGLLTSWIESRLFSTVRVPQYLQGDFDAVVETFLNRRDGDVDDEKEVA